MALGRAPFFIPFSAGSFIPFSIGSFMPFSAGSAEPLIIRTARACYQEGMMITLDEYRAITGLKDTSKDLQIEALIPLVEDDYLAIRGKDWDRAEDGSIIYPAGSKLTAAEMITYRRIHRGLLHGARYP